MDAAAFRGTDRRVSRRATCSTAQATGDCDWSCTGPLPDTGADVAAAMICRVATAGTCARLFAVAAAAFRAVCCGVRAVAESGVDERAAGPGSDGSAEARGEEARAIPIPRATASPPTRPMWHPIPMTFSP